MTKRILERPAVLFVLVLVWKVALLLGSAQPVPSNDAFFYDGPVVNFLLHGKYANPSLVLALPISGNEIFCAYPPLYQFLLLGWLSVFGVSAMAAMFFHLFLFVIFLCLLLAIFRRLNLPEWPASVASAFVLVITFHDRPDSLAHVFGMAAVYFWIRSRNALDVGQEASADSVPLSCRAGEALETRPPHEPAPDLLSPALSSPGGEGGDSGASNVRRFNAGIASENSLLPVSWQSGRNASTWAAVGFVILSLATGLQIGALYFLLIFIGMLATAVAAKEDFPVVPMAAMALVPIALLALVILGFPHLWTGFLEHARQTPSLTGWRVPRLTEILKTLRTVPGILVVIALMPAWAHRRTLFQAMGKQALWLVTLTCTLAAFAVIAASLFVLTPNSIFFASYLQPLIVGCFLGMIPAGLRAERISPEFSSEFGQNSIGRARLLTQPARLASLVFLALAAVGSIRAIGMSTWGLACAADVSYSAALRMVSAELGSCPNQSATVLSSAYLYEAARHENIRWFHSDWLAPAQRHGSKTDLDALISLKPCKIILTQFDYFRRFETVVLQLRQRQDLAHVELVNTARTPAPDSFPSLQKVVQHISWAPVIISLSWQ